MANILTQKAVLATLHISCWTGRRYDLEVTEETNRRHNAAAQRNVQSGGLP